MCRINIQNQTQITFLVDHRRRWRGSTHWRRKKKGAGKQPAVPPAARGKGSALVLKQCPDQKKPLIQCTQYSTLKHENNEIMSFRHTIARRKKDRRRQRERHRRARTAHPFDNLRGRLACRPSWDALDRCGKQSGYKKAWRLEEGIIGKST